MPREILKREMNQGCKYMEKHTLTQAGENSATVSGDASGEVTLNILLHFS